MFVKPAHLGSSVGIVKVTDAQRMQEALTGAFAHDARVIVEAAAPGIEVECGVLGNPRDERGASGAAALASTPGEIVFEGDFYDFEAKYEPGRHGAAGAGADLAARRPSGCASWRWRRLRARAATAWRAWTSSSTARTCC